MSQDAEIQFARTDDFAKLEEIETAADSLLVNLFSAAEWPPTTSAIERAGYPGFTLLVRASAGNIFGFVQVLQLDGIAHLEQLSVLPEHGRQGYGRMLVAAAKSETRRRGYDELTLRTYRDVAWNAPFYTGCGFVVSVPSTEFHLGLVQVEAELGLERWGPRLQMTAELGSS